MAYGRSKIFLLLIVAIGLTSLGNDNYKAKSFRTLRLYEKQFENDSVTIVIDTFQGLIDRYCQSKSIIFANKKELIVVTKQIEQLSDTLKKSITALANYNRTIARIKLQPNADYRFQGDRIKQTIIIFDSLIKISKNEKESIQKELVQTNAAFDSLLRNIKAITLKIKGSLSLNLCGVAYHVYVTDLKTEEIRMHLYKKDKENFYTLGAVREYLVEKGIEPLMITNGGMYKPNFEPQGLYIEAGSKTRYPIDTEKRNTDENFYLMPNGVFFIDSNNVAKIKTTGVYLNLLNTHSIKPKLATQSGPMLVINYAIHPKLTQGSKNEKIRSGVGKISARKIVFATTINESNFYEFASFFKDIFGCRDALFLDGAISKMYLKVQSPEESGGSFGPIISVSKKR